MKLCPSLLAADFSCLSRQIDPLRELGVSHLHLDMMDGHFVQNLAIGFPALESLRAHYPDMEMDAHLELMHPENLVDRLVEAGVDYMAVQVEVQPDLAWIRERLEGTSVQLGLSVNPDTPVMNLESSLESVDYVVLLSVLPGFGGQPFREDVLPKIKRLRNIFDGPIQIDGGINPRNIQKVIEAGADWIVAGSSVFGDGEPKRDARELMAHFPTE